jgi:dUTP pyrophosphatase
MIVNFSKSNSFAKILSPSHNGDAGYDIIATSNALIKGEVYQGKFYKSISYIEYETDIIINPDSKLFSLLFPRSSISKYNLSLCNSVGVIDTGYRDSIKVRFNYLPQPENYYIMESKNFLVAVDESRIYKKGDKIAQVVFTKHVHPKLIESSIDPDSERGLGGFGSTGF